MAQGRYPAHNAAANTTRSGVPAASAETVEWDNDPVDTHIVVASPNASELAETGPHIYLGESRSFDAVHSGDPAIADRINAGRATPLAVVSGDLDGDGAVDLVVGYETSEGGAIAIHRGNINAFAPQNDSAFNAIAQGEFPAPFLPDVQVVGIPVRPDFMAVGRFTPGGHLDLVVASRGGNSIYVFAGDGAGDFGAPRTIVLPGGVTAMAAENLLSVRFGVFAWCSRTARAIR